MGTWSRLSRCCMLLYLWSRISSYTVYIYLFIIYLYICLLHTYIYILCANDLSAVTAVATCAAKTTESPSSMVQQDFPWLQPSRPYPATRWRLWSKVSLFVVEILHQTRDFEGFCLVLRDYPPSNDFQGFCLILQRFQSLELCIRHVHFTTFCCCHWSILLPHAPRWPPVHAPPHRRWQQQAKNLLAASGHLLEFSEFRVCESKLTYWYGYRDAHKSQHPNIAILGDLFPSETNKIWDVAQSVDKAPATRLERLEPSNTVSSLKLAEDGPMERAKHKDLCVKKKQSHHVPHDFMAMGKNHGETIARRLRAEKGKESYESYCDWKIYTVIQYYTNII